MKTKTRKALKRRVKSGMGSFDLSTVRKSAGSRSRHTVEVKTIKWKGKNFSIAKYLRGGFTQDWEHAKYEEKVYKMVMASDFAKAALSSQQMVTGGEVLVPPEYSQEIQQNLRAKAVVRNVLKPREYNMKSDTLYLGKKTGSTSLTWTAEGTDIDAGPGTYESEPTFGRNTLVLKEAIGICKINNNTIADGGAAADDIVNQDLVETVALEEDRVFIAGNGGAEPLGVYNDGFITTTTLATNGDYINYDDLMDAMYTIELANGTYTGWIFHPRIKNHLRKLKDGNGDYLLALGNIEKGNADVLLGLPVGWTTQISIAITTGTCTTTSYGILANWRKFAIGQKEGGAQIVATQLGGSSWNNNQTHFRCVLRLDCIVREPAEVVVIKGIK